MTKSNKPVEIFTDGSSDGKGNNGGYGIVMLFGDIQKKIISKPYSETTSSRMEIKAVVRALEELNPGFDIYIYSDFKIMVDIINVQMKEWIELGTFDKKSNHGLWLRFLRAKKKHVDGGSNLLFSWIRSHSGIKYNDIADGLAMKGRKSKKKIICKDYN